MYIHARALRVPYLIYMRRGLRCCCLDKKAIPEPRLAEQQDCSPAFLLYIYAKNKREHSQQVTAFLLCICPFEI